MKKKAKEAVMNCEEDLLEEYPEELQQLKIGVLDIFATKSRLAKDAEVRFQTSVLGNQSLNRYMVWGICKLQRQVNELKKKVEKLTKKDK